jgi:hypothetical protein
MGADPRACRCDCVNELGAAGSSRQLRRHGRRPTRRAGCLATLTCRASNGAALWPLGTSWSRMASCKCPSSSRCSSGKATDLREVVPTLRRLYRGVRRRCAVATVRARPCRRLPHRYPRGSRRPVGRAPPLAVWLSLPPPVQSSSRQAAQHSALSIETRDRDPARSAHCGALPVSTVRSSVGRHRLPACDVGGTARA